MNIELGDIGNWLTANKLSLNVHKSKYMIYSKSKKLNSYPKLKIDDSIIQQVHEFNFLGITFDDHLNWKLHIERCAFKCSRNIGMLNKLNRFLPTTIMLTLYTYLSILVDGFRVQSRGDHGWPPLACGILSSSSDIEGCRAVVSGVIWIRLLDSARLM